MSSTLPLATACIYCDSHFLNSSLWYETDSILSLHCRKCQKSYCVSNTEEQRDKLKNEFGIPSQVEQLVKFEQMSVGDVIAYKRKVIAFKYQHHGVITAIDNEKQTFKVVEFTPHLPLKKGVVVESRKDFSQEIATENAWLRRYMPLDCLPVPQVLKKAMAFIEDPKSQPAYDLTRCNCHHLSSWCKTGKMISTDANAVRRYYSFIFHGVQFFSLFINPVITIGVTVVDAIIRGGRIMRSEFDLIKKGMADKESLSKDVVSYGISAGVVVVAAATALISVAMSRRNQDRH